MLLKCYAEGVRVIQDAVAQLIPILDDLGLSTEAQSVSASFDSMSANEFNIVIVGQLKRGKSTLVNALLRKPNLMPEGVIPTSSAIVRIRNGKKEEAVVRYLDGESETITLDSLEQFCVEKYNKKNKKGVASIDVELMHPWLAGGARVIDTPGNGSAEAHHDALVMDAIRQAHVAVFVFTADKPISGGEKRLLEEIKNVGPQKILFVLNMKDRLSSEDEVQRVIEHNKGVIAKMSVFHESEYLEFIGVSSRLANRNIENGDEPECSSGFFVLEKRIESIVNRTSMALYSVELMTNRLLASTNQVVQVVQSQEQLAAKTTEELDRRLLELDAKEKELHVGHVQMQDDLKKTWKTIKKEVKEKFLEKDKNLKNSVGSLESADFKVFKKKLKSEAEEAQEALQNKIPEEVGRIVSNKIGPALEKIYKNLQKEQEEIDEEFLDDLFGDRSFDTSASTSPDLGPLLGTFVSAATGVGLGAWWASMYFFAPGLFAWVSGGISTALFGGLTFSVPLIFTGLGAILAVLAVPGFLIWGWKKKKAKLIDDFASEYKKMLIDLKDRFEQTIYRIEVNSDKALMELAKKQLEPHRQAIVLAKEKKAQLHTAGGADYEAILATIESLRFTLTTLSARTKAELPDRISIPPL